MARHIIFMVFAICFWGAAFFTAPAYSDYRIILKNGETISVRNYEMDGDNIVFNKYGGMVSFSRSEVAKIEKDFIEENTDTAEDPEQTMTERISKKSKQKSGQKSEDPRDERQKKIAECQRILKMRKESMEIYCWQAASAKVSAAPNLPQANQARVSEKTGKQFQTHVQSTVDAFKANSTCDYYKRKVAELEKECSEL
ncbi:MAG: hypothetical protein LLG40_11595 [Deltaproteobacteria bacterium]|nr:hypothetical protein [Deltaproteobacteria bacterium]